MEPNRAENTAWENVFCTNTTVCEEFPEQPWLSVDVLDDHQIRNKITQKPPHRSNNQQKEKNLKLSFHSLGSPPGAKENILECGMKFREKCVFLVSHYCCCGNTNLRAANSVALVHGLKGDNRLFHLLFLR